MSDRRLGGP